MATGYEVSFEEFKRLISDPYCQPMVVPRIKEWFGFAVEGSDKSAVVRRPDGTEVNQALLHQLIQADPERQGSLYRVSQTLWR